MRETLTRLLKQFDQGSLSHADAASHHDQVASKLDDSSYKQAAEEAVGKLSQPQKDALGSHLTTAAPSHGIDMGSLLGIAAYAAKRALGH